MEPIAWSKGRYVQFGQYEWLVLKRQDRFALLITRNIIEKRRFDWHSSTWESSKIRAYLNEAFYTSAFTDEERAKIVLTRVKTGKTITEDYIFLLSLNNAQNYFATNEERRALLDGVSCWYWLRSAGDALKNTSYVYSDGSIDTMGYGVRGLLGLRPALWVQQES